MATITDLKKKAGLVARGLGIDTTTFKLLIELLEKKGKISLKGPEKLIRDNFPRINEVVKYPFLFIDLGQKQFFFVENLFPVGNELDKKIKELRKAIAKGGVIEILECQLFFCEEFQKLPMKGFAEGIMKFSKEVPNVETQEPEHWMAVHKSVKVWGTTKKSTLANQVRDMEQELYSKEGQHMYLEPELPKPRPNQVEETQEDNEQDQLSLEDLAKVKQQVVALLGQLKVLKPTNAFKGLGLIDAITRLVDSLGDNAPKEFVSLLEKLKLRQVKLTPILSTQIDRRLGKSMQDLEELPVIQSSSELDEIFGAIQKIYAGWKKFLPEKDHPQGEVIEKVGDEIDILKLYEEKIVPLRQRFDEMSDDSPEKEALAIEINDLVEEARAALG